jgi:hypothetical protein
MASITAAGIVPLPPTRPAAPVVLASLSGGLGPVSAKSDAIAAVVRRADSTVPLPPIITQGGDKQHGEAGPAVLAYAGAPAAQVPQPPARPVAMAPTPPVAPRSAQVKAAAIRNNMVASRLDVVNFRMLTAPGSALANKHMAVVAPTVGSLRSAAKDGGKTLTGKSVAGSVTRFSTADALPTGGFTQN